ncbi:putative holin-like toxin [Hungatella sp.]|nr:putative holin-like toxin [Hungatella sp.]
MSTYEEFMIIINAAMLIIAILVYIDRKNGTKNSRPPFQK